MLAVYSGRRRSVPGALPFAIGSLFAALWAAGSVMEAAAVEVQTKIFWFKFQGVWHPARRHSHHVLCPGICLARALADPPQPGPAVHSLPAGSGDDPDRTISITWGGAGLRMMGTIIPLRGPGNWMFLAYGYGLGIVNLIVLAWLFLRSPQHRWPVVIMLTGLIAGRTLYLLEAAQILPSNLL